AKNTSEIEKLKLAVSQRALQAELDIKAYELVEKTLSLDAAAMRAHGPAAAAIINALTVPPLREGLQNALRAVVTDTMLLKQIDDARQFDLDDALANKQSQVDAESLGIGSGNRSQPSLGLT